MDLTIGYDGKFLWPGMSFGARSGHGVHARQLLDAMLARAPDARFKIYALNDAPPASGANWQTVPLPRYARSSALRNLMAYPMELVRRPVDVMLAYSTLPAVAPCRTVLLLADVFWLANPDWLPRRIALPRTLATRRSARRADHIVTTTEFSRREIIRLLDVPPEKITVVAHGVRPEFERRMPAASIAAVASRHGIGDGRPYVLSLNDIHPRKNLEGLVDAFTKLKARTGLPHRLVIAGRTLWPYRRLHERIAASAFAADIRVLGYVGAADVLPLYQGAALFAYPSFYEGWGLQVHEAMLAGVPCAVANNTTMPEVAGDAADMFDPYDTDDMSRSMERVLTDAALRETLLARAPAQVRRFTWGGAAEATLKVCARLAA